MEAGGLRRLDAEDIPALGELAAAVTWNPALDAWRWMLGVGVAYGVDDGERLAGATLVFAYGEALAMLAMMMVRPERQRGGVGKALLDRALASCHDNTVMALYATQAGERLYRPSGFVDAGSSVRFEGLPDVASAPGATREARLDDLEAIEALDARAQGAPRARLIGSIASRARGVVVERGGEIAGFGFSVPEDGALRLGPIAAARDDDAAAIAAELARGAGAVRLDLEPGEETLRSWAARAGLQVAVVSPRLVRGGAMPGERRMVRALAGRPFG